MRKRTAAMSFVVLGLGWYGPGPASAQYFGQNQVQYRDFDFRILATPHFDVYYYPEGEKTALQVARLSERWYSRFSTLFGHTMRDRQPVVLYASAADFRQTNVVSGLGEGTGGVTESLKRRVVLPSAGALAETNHVLGHELIHAFQYDMSAGASGGLAGGFTRLPLWFVEGMAEYFSLGPVDPQTAMWLRDAVASDELPTLGQLGKAEFFPYRFGHAFWAYVAGRWGDDQAVALFREARRSGDPIAAVRRLLGQDEKAFSKEWGDTVRRTYAGFLKANRNPADYGPLLIGKKRGGGELNLGPAISPDGKRLVFLSERDLFSIDLFLADADTGKVIRKLASTATDPHFDSLQFIDSAGAWSADGRRFVQSALRRGRGAFFIVDPETGRRVREVVFDDIGEVANPVFTPDGAKLVFSGLQGGLLDLWEYDLDSGERRRLTNDAFAELQPAVSPDGTQVAFTTDRFTTRLDTLDFGDYRIGLLDLATGNVHEAPGYPEARHSNPQWSPDGKTLYFLSDVQGATDVHRVDLATGERRAVTQLRTGVYGITALSPSLSVAQGSGRIAYSAREDGEHNIYAIDDAVRQAGVPVPAEWPELRRARRLARLEAPPVQQPPTGGAEAGSGPQAPERQPAAGSGTAKAPSEVKEPIVPTPVPITEALGPLEGGTAVLPPATRVASRVESLLDDPEAGLPSASGAGPKSEPYRAKLHLQSVGQPSIGVGVDRFGTYVGGSTALYFGDMLGDHNLALAFEASGGVRDVAGQILYSNLTRRLDWGIGAQYVPYRYSRGVTQSVVDLGGTPGIVEEYVIERQTDAAVFAIAAHPLSRANRFELQGTLRRFGFSAELRSQLYDYASGAFLREERRDLDTGLDPLYLGSVSGAFVHDTSVFGATSPILGRRYRVEVGQSLGSATYTDLLADWRGYFMPLRPFTLAFRGLHFGRYGSGANDSRFGSLYLGYPDLLRGYDDIEWRECQPNAASECPLFERLFGSRMLVGNAELRAPLFGLFTGRLSYGPLPIEVAAFADAGVAWCGSGSPSAACPVASSAPDILGGDQDFLTSVGVAFRANVFGFLVAEVSWAHPFQRPEKSGIWQWKLSPGF